MPSSSDPTADLTHELRDDAQNLAGAAADRLQQEADRAKSPVVDQAKSVSSALDKAADQLADGQTPDWLRSAFAQGAQQVRRLADVLEQKDSRQLLDDVRAIARDNPATFLTACAAAGFAASRIFKAEPPRRAPTAMTAPATTRPTGSAGDHGHLGDLA